MHYYPTQSVRLVNHQPPAILYDIHPSSGPDGHYGKLRQWTAQTCLPYQDRNRRIGGIQTTGRSDYMPMIVSKVRHTSTRNSDSLVTDATSRSIKSVTNQLLEYYCRSSVPIVPNVDPWTYYCTGSGIRNKAYTYFIPEIHAIVQHPFVVTRSNIPFRLCLTSLILMSCRLGRFQNVALQCFVQGVASWIKILVVRCCASGTYRLQVWFPPPPPSHSCDRCLFFADYLPQSPIAVVWHDHTVAVMILCRRSTSSTIVIIRVVTLLSFLCLLLESCSSIMLLEHNVQL